jgi:hypothetical protein
MAVAATDDPLGTRGEDAASLARAWSKVVWGGAMLGGGAKARQASSRELIRLRAAKRLSNMASSVGRATVAGG